MKFHVAAMWAGGVLMAGCGLQGDVKEATTDKYAFVTKNFSSASIAASVRDSILHVDAGSVPFKKMTLKLVVTPKFYQGAGSPPPRENGITYIAAGGPFVQRIDEVFSNGIETQDYYSLTYRGLLAVRNEGMNVNAVKGGFYMQVRSLPNFQALPDSPGSGDLLYSYSWGTPIQIAGLKDYQLKCSLGEVYSADRINVKFSGQAQDLSCELYQVAGLVSQSRSEQALLFAYGVTVPTMSANASGTNSYVVSSVEIE